MLLDRSKSYLYHLESQWSRGLDPEGNETELLRNQVLRCYDVADGGFQSKGSEDISDIRRTILYYNGQDTAQIRKLEKSVITGMSLGDSPEWDLSLAFESGL